MNAYRHFALSMAVASALSTACSVDDVALSLRHDAGVMEAGPEGSVAGGAGGAGPSAGGRTGAGGAAGNGGTVSASGGAIVGAGGDADGGVTDAGSLDGGSADGSTVATAGKPCSANGTAACAGHAQQQVLTCAGGTWSLGAPCAASNNCDTASGGSCEPIVTECAGKRPGASFCRAKERLECGPDLVTAVSLETCPFVCVSGTCSGECSPGARDCGGGDGGTGRVPRTCQNDGTWLDAAPCPFLCAATTGSCVAATCGDAVQNGDETDRDCGGSCGATCVTGQKCKGNGDCVLPASGKCTAGSCAAATCSDGVKNGSETDADCGGSCATKCPVNEHCSTSSDCANSACVGGTCTGVCSPGAKQCSGNGVETCDSSGKWSAPGACAAGTQICRAGACTTCGAGTANCDSNAADCETNLNATATCGKTCASLVACGANQQCASGVCQCTGGLTLCGSTCIDTKGSDASNCGACGHSCEKGTCVSGRCQPFVLDKVTEPVGLTVTQLKVFWTGPNGEAQTDSVNGGSATNFYVAGDPLATNLCNSPAYCYFDMTSDGTNVYWPVQTSMSEARVQLQTVGGNSPYLYGNQTGNSGYTWVATDGTDIFAAARNIISNGGTCVARGVDWMPISPRSTAMTTWTLGAFCTVNQIAVDSTNLYWTDTGAPNGSTAPGVFMAPKKGTTSTQVDTGSIPTGIAMYGGVLYWTDKGTGTVRMKAGSAAPSTLALSTAPGSMVVDASGVYWIDSGSAILHAPLTGTMVTPSTLASGQVAVTAIATNSSAIFWTNAGTSGASYADGAIMKLVK